MKYGFVYIWRDRKHNKYYIGSHWGNVTDKYICSSTWMRNAYKRRPEDFKRRILSIVISDRIQLLLEEHKWLQMINSTELGKKYYNHFNFVLFHANPGDISKETKKAMWKPEIREKYLLGIKNRNTRSSEPEVREKRRQSMMGKNVGKDTSKACQISADLRRGIPLSNEHRQKIKDTTTFKELNSKKIKCNYCDFIGNTGNVARYHNNKCKQRIVL